MNKQKTGIFSGSFNPDSHRTSCSLTTFVSMKEIGWNLVYGESQNL